MGSRSELLPRKKHEQTRQSQAQETCWLDLQEDTELGGFSESQTSHFPFTFSSVLLFCSDACDVPAPSALLSARTRRSGVCGRLVVHGQVPPLRALMVRVLPSPTLLTEALVTLRRL